MHRSGDVQYKDQVRPSVVADTSASSTLTTENKHDVQAEPSMQPIVFTVAEILPDQNTVDVNVAQLLQEHDQLHRFDSAYHEDNSMPAWRSATTTSTEIKQKSRWVQLRLGIVALLVLVVVICITSAVTVVVLMTQEKQQKTSGGISVTTNDTTDGNTSSVPEEEDTTTDDGMPCAGYSIATTTEITVLPSGQPLPSCLQTLTNLQLLIVRSNNLAGTLPSELGLLTQLNTIDLRENALTGTIPSDLLRSLTGLHSLLLDANLLTGVLPSQMGTSLTQLRLPDNQFTGRLPDSMADLTSMEWFHLYGNQFSGTVPTEIGEWTKLQELSVGDNEMNGTLPTELGRCTQLRGLWLYENNFTGTLPDEWGPMLPTLARFEVNDNLLTGTIPTWVSNVSSVNVGNNIFVEEAVVP